MGNIIVAIGAAVLGAVLGAYLQRMWTPDVSPQIEALRGQVAEFQSRIESLEKERRAVEALRRFSLRAKVTGELPGAQHLVLSGDRDFTLHQLGYISDVGGLIASDAVEAAGTLLEVNVDADNVRKIFNSLPRTGQHPVPIKFHYSITVGDIDRTQEFDALIDPQWRQIDGVTTFCLTVRRGS